MKKIPSVGASEETKQCTTCLEVLPLKNFYSKGKRQDTRCKDCIRKYKRATYEYKKTGYTQRLKNVAEIVLNHEHEKLDELEIKLTEVIERCQRKAQA